MKFKEYITRNFYLEEVKTSIAYDALNILIGTYNAGASFIDIKPKAGFPRGASGVFGHAFTTRGDLTYCDEEQYQKLDRIRLEMYTPEVIKPGSIVLLQANDHVVAHSGDITSLIYKQLGVNAFITDGNVRDLDLIERIPLPTFCEGVNPIDALGYWALKEYNTPIRIKSVNVCPGDLIIADSDGVIVVTKEMEEDFTRVYEEVSNKEQKVRVVISEASPEHLQDGLKEVEKAEGRW